MENNNAKNNNISDIIAKYNRLKNEEINLQPRYYSTMNETYNNYFEEFFNSIVCFDLLGETEQYIQANIYLENLIKGKSYFLIISTDCPTSFDSEEDFIKYCENLNKEAQEIKEELLCLYGYKF